MDGTLLDTEATWLDTVRDTCDHFGLSAPGEIAASLEGATTAQASVRIVAALARTGREAGSAAEVAARLEARSLTAMEGNIGWRPGAEELVSSLHAEGVPLVLVTSSSRRWVAAAARHVDFSAFAHIISADDVRCTKPDPEPYRRAATLVGRAPEECVALEDSEVGLSAALASGCTSVLVRAAEASWGARAHEQLPELRGIDPEWVRAAALRRARAAPS